MNKNINYYGYRDRRTGHLICHNIGKPAILSHDGKICYFYVHGKHVTPKVNEWLSNRKLDIDNLTDEDYYALCIFMEGL